MKQKKHHVIVSLASNTQQETQLAKAREQLALILGEPTFTSAHWTKPINSLCENLYLNQLCQGTTDFGQNLLNEVLKEIEKRLGRTHNEDGIVAIDLDLLEYDGQRYHLRDWERPYIKDLLSEL